MKKKQDGSFLNDSVNYKTGIRTEAEDPMLADARKRAAIKYQMQLEEERHNKRKEKIDEIKKHAIPFGLIYTDFKIVFVCSLIAFLGNIILSILYKNLLWTNIFNLLAAFIILFAGKHIYTTQEDETESKITQILKYNIGQVTADIITYKLPKIVKEQSTKISDIIAVIAAICFALFSSQNILFGASTIACFFVCFLLTGLKQFEELKSHLQMLNKSLLVGIFIKAIYGVIFTTKYIQIDYMNIVLLFFFTCLQMWLVDEELMERG